MTSKTREHEVLVMWVCPMKCLSAYFETNVYSTTVGPLRPTWFGQSSFSWKEVSIIDLTIALACCAATFAQELQLHP